MFHPTCGSLFTILFAMIGWECSGDMLMRGESLGLPLGKTSLGIKRNT